MARLRLNETVHSIDLVAILRRRQRQLSKVISMAASTPT